MTLKSPYWLIVFPRLFQCMLSFLVDYSMYKICSVNFEDYRGKMLILASSYVMFVYGTRTFSNSVEMILLAVLLYLVADSQTYSYAVIRQNEFLTKKYNQSKQPVEKARLHKMKLSLPDHTMRNCVLVATVTVVGIFNRPTFITFALPCIFFWVHRGLGSRVVRFSEFHYRMLLLVLAGVLCTTMLVTVDSFYFGYISVAELQQLDVSINSFVVTPFNFIKYNSDVKKLAMHGLHPRVTHLFVNIPLLYNVLGVIALMAGATLVLRLVAGNFSQLPRVHSTRTLMIASTILPLATLSYFPHQEPRFLIPVTLPLVYLFGDTLAGRRRLLRLWLLLNTACVLFFGFVHQAGLMQLASHMAREVQISRQPVHLITSHVYSMPASLLVQRNSRRLYGSGASKYMLPKAFVLHELGSKPPSIVLRRLAAIQQMIQSLRASGRCEPRVYLALPATKEHELQRSIHNADFYLNLLPISVFYPHISIEALPIQLVHWTNILQSFPTLRASLSYFFYLCGLNLYQVHFYNETCTVI